MDQGENGVQSRAVKGAIFEVLLEGNKDKWLPVELLAIVEAIGVRDAISRLTDRDATHWECGWAVGSFLPHSDLDSLGRYSINNVAICGIAVLRLREAGQSLTKSVRIDSSRFAFETVKEPEIGRPLRIHSSPFGLVTPLVLSNTISRGIVSNVVTGRDPQNPKAMLATLLITDVRVLPGMEGAPCFIDSDVVESGWFVGLLMIPIRRKDGDPVDLSFIVPARTILSAIAPLLSSPLLSPAISTRTAVRHAAAAINTVATLARTRAAVVLVEVSNTWASGVVVSSDGYILTNAHVFYDFLEEDSPGSPHARLKKWVRIRVRLGERWFDTVILDFVCLSHWDVALLRLDGLALVEERQKEGGLPFVQLPEKDFGFATEPSLPVLALGHGIFGSRARTACTVTSGVVSKVVQHCGEPVMVVSSAKVHRGCSGGVLVDAERPDRVVGLISSNARTKDGITVTEVNFAIPTNQLVPIAQFLRTRDRETLVPLELVDTQIEDIWFLRTTLPQLSHPENSQLPKSKL
ncbi:trypsin-like cysteine/serine peptidase domain-containing protein [Endogone sp. FLAS-F59071]|nr:trypsin-like cysteine/serine peptidase domain-containing protein [Endogone sp. FLAS-F59071]|eukprot:RUS17242.1 trypsin-like cysteine/serine peptidase domain-containing protein [Endogone sp. FLAS-F59071]